MNKKLKILVLGNVKGDSTSMRVYLNFLKEILKKEDADFLEPSPKFIPKDIFKIFFYPLIIKKDYDVYHIIDHSYSYLINFLPKDRTIITCHDLIPLKFSERISLRGRILFRYYIKLLKKARAIIADSNNTKRDLMTEFKIIKNKIKVIPPISIERKKFSLTKKRIKEKRGLEDKIILLSVGSFFYKNTLLILKSLNYLKEKYPNIVLIKIGEFLKEEKKFIEKNDLQRFIIKKSSLTQKELEETYYLSDILVFPSLYEGFGIPPLEAMACGTPVITSNTSSLPEVVKDAAIKINPHSVEELKRAIITIIENKKIKKKLIKEGYKNLKRFKKNKIKSKLLRLYKKCAE
ncbi:MAG: glycosyltransferase family 1 protein [Candidatus Pacearchaeota archaeon]